MDLFSDNSPCDIELPQANLRLYYSIGLPEVQGLLDKLICETPWQQEDITVYGKSHPQPRLTAWYGDPGASYTYSGITLEPLPWTTLLQEVRRTVETVSTYSFNSVLLNYYRNERDSMGMHSDDEPELGPEPVIASLSLGEERTINFKHEKRKDLDTLKQPLPSGSLLLMRGQTQRYWRHGMNKLSRPCGPRVNLTFRQIHQ